MNADKKDKIKKTISFLNNMFQSNTVEYLGCDRYIFKININDISYDNLIDSEGVFIPLTKCYNNIFRFVQGFAVVVVRDYSNSSPKYGLNHIRKSGIINYEGKEILPCDYDMISIHLDGFIELTKNDIKKSTNCQIIQNGDFNWDNAIKWNH